MEAVEHWWNSLWGTTSRRDVWLRHDHAAGAWEIEVRHGDQTSRGAYPTEDEARAVLDELVSRGPGAWRRLNASSSRRRAGDRPPERRNGSDPR